MRNAKIIIFVLLIANITPLLSGCWNYQEINDLAIVAGMAVDRDRDTGNYIMTVEIVSAQNGGGGQGSLSPAIYDAQGKTIFEAVRNIILKVGKRLYWSHAKVGIISEDIAREGVVAVIDWIERDAEVRTNMRILISKEKTAGEIFYSFCPIETTVSFQIEKILENTDVLKKAPDRDLWGFINDLSSEGVSAVLPIISLAEYREGWVPHVYGTAVFKSDKLVGYLDGMESQSLEFIKDEVESGIIPIENVAGTADAVSLEVFGNTTKIKTAYKKGKILIKVDIDIDVSIGEIEGTTDVIDPKGQAKLISQAEKFMEEEIKGVIKRVQNEYQSDIFGFGSKVRKETPDTWKKLKSNWNEEFANLDFEVKVRINIKSSAATSEPIKLGD